MPDDPVDLSTGDHCALMLQVMAGYDPLDPTTVDLPVPDYIASLNGRVEGVRIGLPMKYFFAAPDLDGEVKDAVLAGAKLLGEAGAIVTEVDLPYAGEAKDANMIIMYGEAFAYHRDDLAAKYDTYGRYTAEVLTRGALISASDYTQAQRFRSYWKKVVAEAMAPLDVLITPTSISPAPKRADMSPEKQLGGSSFTGQWNLTGLPAMAIPCGFSRGGLPLSMQVIGKPFAEATVFKVGDAYQRLTDFHLQVPPITKTTPEMATV